MRETSSLINAFKVTFHLCRHRVDAREEQYCIRGLIHVLANKLVLSDFIHWAKHKTKGCHLKWRRKIEL
jgi:hypothetical protein